MVVFLQFVDFLTCRTFLVGICFLRFVSGIRGDLNMAIVLNCAALVATVGKSASAIATSTRDYCCCCC